MSGGDAVAADRRAAMALLFGETFLRWAK